MIYFKLMKVFFKENFSLKRIIGTDIKASKTKAILLGLLIVYSLGVILFGSGYLFFDLGEILAQANMENLLLDFVFIYATALSLFFVLFRANGYLFHYKDFDILQPLPIKSRVVILAKLTVMLAFIYLSIFIIISPIVFSYFYHGGFNFFSFVFLIALMLMIPLIPLIFFSFVSLLIANFSSRFRFGKALNLILMFVFFLGVLFFSTSMSFENENPLLGQMNIMETLSKIIPTARWFNEAVHDLNVLSLLGMIGLSLGLFVGFVFLIEKMVIKTNQLGMNVRVRKSNKAFVSKSRNIIGNIIIKEVRKFFSVTVYVFNSGFGPIMMAIGGVAILIFRERVIEMIGFFEGTSLSLEVIILVILGFMISTVFTSAISLSLEGKNFWILKSIPVKAETIMFGKLLFNVLIAAPFAIFALLMSSIAFNFSFVNTLLMVVYLVGFCFLSSGLGSIINLYFPKFNYVNETEVVKQSIGALFGMFVNFLIIVINGFMYYYLVEYLGFTLVLLLVILVNLALSVFVYFFIKKMAQGVFNKL